MLGETANTKEARDDDVILKSHDQLSLSFSFSFPSIPLFLPSSLLFNAFLCESKTILVDSLHLGLHKELEVVLSPAYHIFSTVELWFIGFSFLGMFFILECFPFFNHCVTLHNPFL